MPLSVLQNLCRATIDIKDENKEFPHNPVMHHHDQPHSNYNRTQWQRDQRVNDSQHFHADQSAHSAFEGKWILLVGPQYSM